jgi:hypothetical protein
MRHIRVVEQKLKNMQFRRLHRAAPSWSYSKKNKQTGGTYIGVHIRTNQPDAEPGFALPDSAYTPEGWVTLKQMRSRTRVEVFIAEIERLFESVGDPSVCEVLSTLEPRKLSFFACQDLKTLWFWGFYAHDSHRSLLLCLSYSESNNSVLSIGACG